MSYPQAPTLLRVREVGGASVRTSIPKGPGEGLKIRQAQRPKEACSLGLGENFRASESRSQACLDYAERSRKSQREKRTFKNKQTGPYQLHARPCSHSEIAREKYSLSIKKKRHTLGAPLLPVWLSCYPNCAKAWSRSAIKSSMCSIPMLRRTVEGVMCCAASSSGDIWEWVVV